MKPKLDIINVFCIYEKSYHKLLDLLYSKTEHVTFCATTEFCETEVGRSWLTRFEPYTIKRYKDKSYCSRTYKRKMEIIVLNFTTELLEILKEQHGFFDWQWPNFPENPCFYHNNTCFMETYANDKECTFFNKDKELLRVLKEDNMYYYKKEYYIDRLRIKNK